MSDEDWSTYLAVVVDRTIERKTELVLSLPRRL